MKFGTIMLVITRHLSFELRAGCCKRSSTEILVALFQRLYLISLHQRCGWGFFVCRSAADARKLYAYLAEPIKTASENGRRPKFFEESILPHEFLLIFKFFLVAVIYVRLSVILNYQTASEFAMVALKCPS